MKIFPREFYMQDTLTVARMLLGKYLVRNTGNNLIIGRIVETEGYMGPDDKAAHSYNLRRTERNEIMYGLPGFAYVYFIYGMYYCMNVVTQDIGTPQAVLIRALEPVGGLQQMSHNRYGKDYDTLSKMQKKNLANGPGKLCIALNINRSDNGEDLLSDKLYIAYDDIEPQFTIESSPRINIGYAEEAIDYPWRFYMKDNTYVSKSK
ncbi:putative 3-methyladenine DNA glycosylase [Oxobacter pfennigii]|uniref:Putative 3-methyladenine DNA glycosylase n=1 Tax=Oxobacter pfennigii TaxID=36849 RepID=A0A0P9AJ17_9CLOT|nr:DNA-3-methyladenine glycosylase [Oxobacter pfennigii]KPU45436.1 putative 3-methyladenine DNA glycosylase [Oxobacter pfennigii]